MFLACPCAPAATAEEFDREQAIEREFQDGLANVEQGDPDAAIRTFRNILAANPGLIRVRLELANAYFEAGQWERARNEFFIVLSGDIPPGVRETVLDFIQAIDARRGFDWDLSVAMVQTGNRRNYDTDEILLNFGGVILPFKLERDLPSGIGLNVLGSVQFRRRLGLRLPGETDVSTFSELYLDATDAESSESDDTIVGARVGLRFSAPRTTYAVAPIVSARYLGGEHFENRYGVELSAEHRTGRSLSLFGNASRERIDNMQFDDLDGHLSRAQIGFRNGLAGRAYLGAMLFGEVKDVPFNLDRYDIYGVRVFGALETRSGLTVAPRAFYATKVFRDPNPLYTASPDERTAGVGLRVEKNNWFLANNFSPFLDVEAVRTESDIAALSYNEQIVAIGLSRPF
jgi:hypothetical protein